MVSVTLPPVCAGLPRYTLEGRWARRRRAIGGGGLGEGGGGEGGEEVAG